MDNEPTPILLLEQKLGKKIAEAMATAFLHDTSDIVDKLNTCVDAKDSANLRLVTHKLAGCSASIMDKETHQLCRSLEEFGDGQSWDDALTIYEALKKSLEKTRESLSSYLMV